MKIKRLFSLFIVGTMLATNIPVTVFADDTININDMAADDVIVSDGAISVLSKDISADFKVQGKWDNGFNGEITITNLTDEVIENWQIEMSFPQKIVNMWNAQIVSYEDGVYNIKNAGGNNNVNIPVGGSVTFGFIGNYEDDVIEPSDICLVNAKQNVNKEQYTTKFEVLSDWNSGFTAQITITNNTDQDIEGWHLLFNFDKEITSIWNGVIEYYEDGRYCISNSDYNSVIPSNGSVTFGFIGMPGSLQDEPCKYDLIQSNNKDKLFVSFDMDGFVQLDDSKLYLFDKIEAITGDVYSLYGLKELNYTIKYGNLLLDKGSVAFDSNGTWRINPITLMAEIGYEEIGNVIIIEAEDYQGNKTQNSIQIYNHYFDDDLYNTLDFDDNDGDGLFNYQEDVYGTNCDLYDTDSDGLGDYYEVKFTYTDPLLTDTDNNGIYDGDEDFDSDTLTNSQEMVYSSDPHLYDTDGDGLNDTEEILNKTDVWKCDTDNDGLFDLKELELGTDPLNPDSNGNGILDGDETYTSVITPDFKELDTRVIPTLKISADPNLINTVEVSKVVDTVFLVEDMPGFLGSGYEFEMAGTFDEASLTFKFDSKYLDLENFDPAIYYFDEDEQVLEPLNNQSVDLQNCTVSAELEHFSEYILLNRTEFEKAWAEDIIAPVSCDALGSNLNVVLCIDSSGSMDWNDSTNLRKTVATAFINSLNNDDRVAVIDFDSSAKILCDLTSNKETAILSLSKLDSYGGTSLSAGIKKSMNSLNKSNSNLKFIIMLTDGDGYYNSALSNQAKEQGIKIYTVGLGNGISESCLQEISTVTGGRYYYAAQANDLIDEFKTLTREIIDITTDTDKDGLSDYHESHIRLCNGTYINTNVNLADTDGDGIPDGDELVPVFLTENTPGYVNGNNYFKVISNPTMKDTDNDGLTDNMESYYGKVKDDMGIMYLSDSINKNVSSTNDWKLPNGYSRLKSTLGYMYTKALKGDTDGDGLSDSAELGQLIEIKGEKYYNLNSNPMTKDSDYDGVDDFVETKCQTGTVISPIDVIYNNPLKYNYRSTASTGFGIIDPVIELPKKAKFNSIGNNGIFKICSLNAKEKIIKNTQTNQWYALVAKSGVQVRGGTINSTNGDFRGCHYDEIYVKVEKRDKIFNEDVEVYKYKTYEPFSKADKWLDFGLDAVNGKTDWLPSEFLYYDASKDCCYTNEPGDGFSHDTPGYSTAWENIHWYERFWMNAEYDRFLPFDENIVKSDFQNILTENDHEDKASYHNPNYNNKYCSSDGLEGLYDKSSSGKLSLFRGNKYFDDYIRSNSMRTNFVREEKKDYKDHNDMSCISNIYDACMTHGPTFNYCPPNGLISDQSNAHYYFDMIPYYWWGNCP